MKPRVDELKWLLTIIGTLAGFFAIAQGDVRMASKVIEHLERATTVSYVRKEIIKTDFEDSDKGDLVGLIKLADETLREKLQRLRKRLEQAADTGEREPKRQSFLEALKGARNTFAELRRNPGAPN